MVELTSEKTENGTGIPARLSAGLGIGAVAADPNPLERTWADRCLWTMVGVGLLVWASSLIAEARYSWTVAVLVLCNVWGLGTVVASWIPDNRWTLNRTLTSRLAWITALITLGTVLAWGVGSLEGGPFYGTDEIAFNQYAAQLVQHGLNPYTHSMRPAFQLFQTPTSYYTYSFSGKPVTALSYPTLSFLVYVPFLLLGLSYNLAPTLCITVWCLGALLLFALLPKRARPAALLFGGCALYASYALGGVTDAMYMPMLLIASYKWDRFGYTRWSYIGPVMFGLAMGVKQTPWLVLPFMVLALACDEYERSGLRPAIRRGGIYLGIALVTFLIPNLPWLIAAPSAWVKGVLTPLFSSLVPTGQGTVSLSLYLHLGGGSTFAFTVATAFALLLLLIAYVGAFPVMRVTLIALASFVFLFGARSNVNYFISLLPIALLAAVTASPIPLRERGRSITANDFGGRFAAEGSIGQRLLGGPFGPFRNRAWALATAICAVLFLGAVVRSLTASPLVSIKIAGFQTTGNTNHIDQLRLRVTNTTDHPVSPQFDIIQNEYNSTFWKISRGPKALASHATVIYVLQTRNSGAQPSIYSSFNVVGYLTNPDSFSVSPPYNGNLMTVAFNPTAINQTLTVGKPERIGVQLFKNGGPELHRAGVPVSLRVVKWTPGGPNKAYVRIDGGPVGYRMTALTNAHGEAFFTVVGVRATQVAPDSFTAFLYDKQFKFVYGNSGDLDLRFVAR